MSDPIDRLTYFLMDTMPEEWWRGREDKPSCDHAIELITELRADLDEAVGALKDAKFKVKRISHDPKPQRRLGAGDACCYRNIAENVYDVLNKALAKIERKESEE